jgi:cytochrome c peroxidase
MKYALLFFIMISYSACKIDPAFLNSDGHSHTHYDLNIPAGLPSMKIPADNPMSVEGIALGRKLFYDNILSANNTQNCGSCHQLRNYFVDSNKRYSTGIDQVEGTRNSMPLFNIGYAKNFLWDGSSSSLEEQVIFPITNPVEMHETLPNVVAKLQAHPEYPSLFKVAFGSDIITAKEVMYAIAQFERTLISANSKFDKWKRGEVSFTEQETRGLNVFLDMGKGDCTHCHSYGSTFTDFEFKNNGIDSIPIDKGRALVTKLASDEGKFKTPTLRNIEKTAPYMHDGRFKTLREVIDHYNKNFFYTANLAPELRTIPKNRMTEQDIDDIIAFLKTLTDEEFIQNPLFDKP